MRNKVRVAQQVLAAQARLVLRVQRVTLGRLDLRVLPALLALPDRQAHRVPRVISVTPVIPVTPVQRAIPAPPVRLVQPD